MKEGYGPFVAAIYDKNGNLVAKTANTVVKDKCPLHHAEMNCIINVSRTEMLGADLYLAGFDLKPGEAVECVARPCEICLRLIKNAGINRVINKNGVIYQRDSEGILREVKND